MCLLGIMHIYWDQETKQIKTKIHLICTEDTKEDYYQVNQGLRLFFQKIELGERKFRIMMDNAKYNFYKI